MKATDLNTIGRIVAEYGMQSGSSTPVGQQQSGSTAKANKNSMLDKPAQSSLNKPSSSPTLSSTPSTALGNDKDKPDQQPVVAKAKELEQDFEFPDEKGNVVKVVSPAGQGKNKDTVIVQNQKDKEYYTMSPDDDVALPQVDAEEIKEKFNADKLIKRKNKLKKKIKHLLRAQKHMQQGDPVFEINFNNKQVAQSALNAEISCGFEAETVWPNLEPGSDEGDMDWLDDLPWHRVSDLIDDQEGYQSRESVEEAYREWLQESDYFYDVEREVIDELVQDRKEDEAYLNDFIIANSSLEDEIEEYKVEKLERLELDSEDDEDIAAEFEEYSDWDDDAWGREYIEINKQDEYIEWIEEQIRENGEQWDDTWERAMERYDIYEWIKIEHGGSWYNILSQLDIYLHNENGQGGVEEVASILQGWAESNSKSGEVEAGEYHQGAGNTTQDYWRVEEDSSIDGSGAKAEIISPVYDSPAEMLKEMKSLFEFMSNNDAETNRSTGLHVTMSLRGDADKENPLKLALLLGDKYLLKQFGREFNSYAKSQQDRVIDQIKRMDLSSGDVSSEELDELENMLKRGIDYGKFTSINFKDMTNNDGNKLIEFRIGGGEDYHEKFDTVAKSAIRYAVTMQAAHDDQAYRQDYVRAIMRLVDSAQDGFSDSEREKLQKGAGLELPQTRFVDYIKSISSKQHYMDNLQLLKSAYDSTMSGNDALYDLLYSVLNKQVETPAKVTSQVFSAMREMIKDFKFNADDFFGNYLNTKSLTDRTPFELTQYIDAFNQLAKTKHKLPASAKVETITVPDGHVLFMKREDAFNLRDHEDWDTSMFKFVEREVWSVASRALQLLTDPTMGPDHLGWDTAIGLFGGGSGDEDIAKSQAKKYIDNFTRTYGFTPALSGNQDDSNSYSPINVISMNRALASHPTKKGKIVSESAFDKFGQLPLIEQLRILSKVDKRKLDEAWSKKYKKSIDCNNPKGFSQKAHCAGKKKNETIEAEQDMAALLTAYGTPKKKKSKNKKVKEGAVPDHNIKRDFAELMSKPLLGSDLQGQMNAFFIVPDPAMVRDFRTMVAQSGTDVDLRGILETYAKAKLHPDNKKRAGIRESKLAESRGVTARQPGEQYVSASDPNDLLTLQDVSVFPPEGEGYENTDELLQVLGDAVPKDGQQINDNNYNKGTRAAIVASLTDSEGNPQYWIRYIKSVPAAGVDGLWKTLKGYRYSKGAETESVPLKPTDVLTADKFMGSEELAKNIIGTISEKFAGTQYEPLVGVMEDAVNKARANDSAPVENSAQYMNVLVKYGGEYLGPLALIDGNSMEGDTPKMLEAYGLQSLKGSQVMFPGDTAYELVDSIIRTPDNQDIGISSKAHKGGGAASSLSGIVKQLTPEIEEQYPNAVKIIKLIGTESAIKGPLLAAIETGVLSQSDVQAIASLDKGSRDINDLKSERVRELVQQQGVADINDPNYRILWHAITAVVNAIIPVINSDPEFAAAMKAALNNNNFLQLMTNGKKSGDGVSLTYYTKYPAVFAGSPKLYNKSYYATGQKGRLGFKLKK